MRAIDGDVLFREMEKAQWYNNADRDEIAEELVLNAPTIEPQRTGRWIKHIDDLFPVESTIECSECHHEQPLTIDSNFCPNCGAEMEGQDDGI